MSFPRARRRVTWASSFDYEEKKDDDGCYHGPKSADVDPPQSIDGGAGRPDAGGRREPPPSFDDARSRSHGLPTKKARGGGGRPLLLLLCAAGITSCYLWYGTVQERIFHMDAADGEEDDGGGITLFLLATGTFTAFLLALVWTAIGPIVLSRKADAPSANEDKHPPSGTLNHPLIFLSSLAYLSAMAASNESLRYVSYPTCVLAKSSKLIPTMVVGWLVDRFRDWRAGPSPSSHRAGRKSVDAMEWAGALLITAGILCFQYVQLHKQSGVNSHHGGKEDKPDSPYGLALLGLSLLMDGVLGACQSALKRGGDAAGAMRSRRRPPTAMETMLYINLYATLALVAASRQTGQLDRGMAMLTASDRTKAALFLQLNFSASLGQVFVFLTIHHFSPLTCTTITTTRKFFTILLSVYRFGHVLDARQWASVGLVFGGLYLGIAAKLMDAEGGGTTGGNAAGKEKEA